MYKQALWGVVEMAKRDAKAICVVALIFSVTFASCYFAPTVLIAFPSVWDYTAEEEMWIDEAKRIKLIRSLSNQTERDLAITSTATQLASAHNIGKELSDFMAVFDERVRFYGSAMVGLVAIFAAPFAFARIKEMIS